MTQKVSQIILFTLALILVTICPAFASLTYNYETVYSGITPTGDAPWMSATFQTGAAPNTTTLTLQGINLTSTEFVSNFAFNYTGTNNLTIGFVNPWSGASAGFSQNGYSADGAGGFDILVSFPTDNTANRFNNSDTAVLTIAGTSNPYDFYGVNAGPGIQGIFTAAHVQGIGPEGGSGWATVPIPSTVWLLGAGLLGMIGIRRGFLK